ncbi:MAG: hypothetical protein RLN89_14620 [Parvibaculum sp.]
MTDTDKKNPTQAEAGTLASAAIDDARPDNVDRWTLIRDVFVFQGKLVLDGLRDLILSPLSIAAAIIALVTGGEKPGRQFYDLLYFGRRSEHWINLFGATSHVKPPATYTDEGNNIDALVDRLDELARRKYEQGGLTQNAKDAVDKALDAVNRGLKNRGPDDPASSR